MLVATVSLAAAAEAYAATATVKRCRLCHDATQELRDVVDSLRTKGLSVDQLSDFLRRTADEYGHGIRQSGPSIANHYKTHAPDVRPVKNGTQTKPRRRR